MSSPSPLYKNKKLKFTGVVLFFSLLFAAGSVIVFERLIKDRVLPNVSLGGIELGLKTKEEVYDLLQKKVDSFEEGGIEFSYETQKATLPITVQSSENIELAYQLLRFDIDAMVREAYQYGRESGFTQNITKTLKTVFLGVDIEPIDTFDDKLLFEILEKEFHSFILPASNAAISYSSEQGVHIKKERLGRTLDRSAIIKNLQTNLRTFTNSPISFQLITEYPKITSKDLSPVLEEAESIIRLAPITVVYNEKELEVEKNTLGSWLTTLQDETAATPSLRLQFNQKILNQFFDSLVPEIEIPPVNAKFIVENGRVKEFQRSVSGIKIDREKTLQQFTQTIIDEKQNRVSLAIAEATPEITSENVNDLGILKIIGVGKSNFTGSPKNRRHNIRTGAETLNGVLIAPNEEFSLVKALGEIDGEHGYLPELVIKQNKTIPEFGGGLCQIGTTIFRAAMASGLPILERQNHSYTVSYYYEDGVPGTDATIYPPHPDFRFLNDTPAHILIQTKIEGDDLVFEFWGTSDGRKATRTKPEVWDRVSPGPTKIIESADLKPGEKKCTEKAHDGIKAKFTYRVEYPNGDVKEKEFYSSYKPWQAVCLVGAEQKEDTPEKNSEESSSSEPEASREKISTDSNSSSEN